MKIVHNLFAKLPDYKNKITASTFLVIAKRGSGPSTASSRLREVVIVLAIDRAPAPVRGGVIDEPFHPTGTFAFGR